MANTIINPYNGLFDIEMTDLERARSELEEFCYCLEDGEEGLDLYMWEECANDAITHLEAADYDATDIIKAREFALARDWEKALDYGKHILANVADAVEDELKGIECW